MLGKIDRITLSITVNSKIASSRDPFNTERTFIIDPWLRRTPVAMRSDKAGLDLLSGALS
jgi:hypothetical protein